MKLRSGIVVLLSVFTAVVGCATAKEGTVSGGVGGAAGGAAAGAAAGAPVAGVGAIVGGALGAAGGAIVGARNEYNNEQYREQALRSSRLAEQNPALASAVRDGGPADLNDDGFITTDEIIALHKAGLDDDEIIARLRASQQVFGLTSEQEQELLKAGVSQRVVTALRGMNAELTNPRRSG
jgi:hypothetical protein